MTIPESNSIEQGSSDDLHGGNGTIFRSESPHAVAGQELLRADAGNIEAIQVSMDHSGAESIKAARVSMDHSGAKDVTARTAQLDQSGVMSLKADQLVLQQSSGLFLRSATSRIVNSKILFLSSDNTELDANSRVLMHFGRAGAGVTGKSSLAAAAAGGLSVLAMVLSFRMIHRLFGRQVEEN